MTTVDDKIADLIDRANRAENGAVMAESYHDKAKADELTQKSARLIADALALDPERKAPAWRLFCGTAE